MEQKILGIMAGVDAAGSMCQAVEQGLVRKMIGASGRVLKEQIGS